jgi:hypothetical protein
MTPTSSTRDRALVASLLGGAGIVLLMLLTAPAAAQSLRGSPASLDRQNHAAREHDFTYLTTSGKVRQFVDRGYLVKVEPSRDVEFHAVSYPYARPEVELFIRRLGSQYRSACGERLVVTSLTRPTSKQPHNASERSVHPTGMALDLRYSRSARCRHWIEGVLLSLEKTGVVEATKERFPPHYHVAVFPRQYLAYVDGVERRQGTTRVAAAPAGTPSAAQRASAISGGQAYRVRSGDSLWAIARAHGTTVGELRAMNNLRSSRIQAGQVLEVPAR